jgi:hypothetical protein
MADSSDELPSPAWLARGRPKDGRGLRAKRRIAPLDKKGGEGRKRLSTPHRKEISGASRRMIGSPLSRPSATLSPCGGRGESIGRTRHCEGRRPVAIQFVPCGEYRRCFLAVGRRQASRSFLPLFIQRRYAPFGTKPSPALRASSRPPSGEGASIRRIRHCKKPPPPRHCEERSDAAIHVAVHGGPIGTGSKEIIEYT